ncbi:ABC transporter permease [Bailinhaonella thermotolerans]|uniref:ABC transporter permease n=1 Tax=Bailinhaonella thermotolerans TaxID=1070861 RepID=A0A3A3ZWQ4_9ACTN|nr:ABC transporter permease [Bailinhaonella thermotolerans]
MLRGAAGVAGLLIAWELVVRTGLVSDKLLPYASTVLVEAVRILGSAEFLTSVAGTMTAWAIGLLYAIAIAVPLGILLGSLPAVEIALRPIVEFLRPIPSVALIPVVTFFAPEALELKVVLIVFASSWPLLINTMYGLRDVDPLAKETLRSFGFGPLAVLYRVSLPSTAPFILTGVRLAAGVALILAISAELLGSGGEGIGIYTIRAGSGASLDLVLAATLWTGMLGILINTLLVRAERRLFPWREATA